MKKIIFADFMEFNSHNKLANYHYAKLFAENGYKVLWLSCPWNFLVKIKDPNVYENRKLLSSLEEHEIDKNIYGFAPYSLRLYGNYPFCKSEKIIFKFDKYIKPDIKKSLEVIGFDKVNLIWISNPKQYWIKNVVSYEKLVYRISDDFKEFSSFPQSVINIDKKLINESNICFASSKNLIQKKKTINNNIKYLPNAVELKNFIKDKYIMPREFKNDNSKKVIYVGYISQWFDVNLIKSVAEKLKDISFYIIGQPKIDLSLLNSVKNVFAIGKRAYEDIANYLYYSDVGIIPFKVNNLTDSVSPIKLFEYMSVGLNVVSTNFKEMACVNNPAYVSKNYDEFCKYIQQAIEEKEKNREKNIQFAKENTWESRFEEILKYI